MVFMGIDPFTGKIVPEFTKVKGEIDGKRVDAIVVADFKLSTVMVATGTAKSRSEARRLIKAGAVRVWQND
jgi:RNA-binding protein YlmH